MITAIVLTAMIAGTFGFFIHALLVAASMGGSHEQLADGRCPSCGHHITSLRLVPPNPETSRAPALSIPALRNGSVDPEPAPERTTWGPRKP